jgi:hypothetical protein
MQPYQVIPEKFEKNTQKFSMKSMIKGSSNKHCKDMEYIISDKGYNPEI